MFAEKSIIMECIKNRRTIRKYKQEDVPAALLHSLLEEAFRASTMGNMQLYSVVITRDPQMKAKLAPAHFNQPMVTGAPVVLTFCADFNRFSKWCRCRKAAGDRIFTRLKTGRILASSYPCRATTISVFSLVPRWI